MDMGFNGARLHEKIFEERFLYHCDRMGYLVWGEYPDWGLDNSLADPIYTYDRRPKFNPQTLKSILSRPAAIEQE